LSCQNHLKKKEGVVEDMIMAMLMEVTHMLMLNQIKKFLIIKIQISIKKHKLKNSKKTRLTKLRNKKLKRLN